MLFSLPGVHVPHRKHTGANDVSRMPLPKSVTIPTSMHIGKPARATVKVGDKVFVGTLIAEADGAISSPIYSSVSGTVTKIYDMLTSNGTTTPAIVIESDGLAEADPSITPPTVTSREELIEAIQKSGIVGLGGAGFPSYVKFSADPEKIEALVLNGAECEPYITSDTVTMVTRVDDMKRGIEAIQKFLGIKRVIIGIENNKPDAIASMQAMAEKLSGVEVFVLPSLYPQGAEKVLVYHTLGKIIPEGKLPLDVGAIVANVTTVAAIGAYLESGMPLVEKCVTVDGMAVARPQNVIAPIGASMQDLFDFCGGLVCEPERLVYGGPMMGVGVIDSTAPILKNTNAILALRKRETRFPKPTACIRCGACTNHCPFGLAPAAMMRAYERRDAEALASLKINLCMECGSCNYTCPANRPLVQTNRLAKAFVREQSKKEVK